MPSFPCSHHPKGPKSHSAQINNLTTELSPDGKDATGRFRENPIFSNTIGSAGGPIFHVHIGNPGGGMCGRRSGGGSRVGLSSCKSRLVDCYVGDPKKKLTTVLGLSVNVVALVFKITDVQPGRGQSMSNLLVLSSFAA